MMKLIVYIIIIPALISISIEIKGQHTKAAASLDTNVLRIGDQTLLHLNVACKPGTVINWPLLADTLINNVEILSRTPIDTSDIHKDGIVQYTQSFLITSFDSGYYAIPPFVFAYRLKEDTVVYFAETEPLLLSVYTINVDTTQSIKPIKGTLNVPLTFKEILPYLLVYFLSGILVPGFYYYRKRKKKPEFIFTRKPKLPPHVLALQALERLRKEKLWQTGKVKEYHTLLTEIIRIYIEERFLVPAIELTTSEILESFRKIAVASELKLKLKEILELADLVKFAKAQPLPDQHGQSLDDAVCFVEKTIPVLLQQTLITKNELEDGQKQLSSNDINVKQL